MNTDHCPYQCTDLANKVYKLCYMKVTDIQKTICFNSRTHNLVPIYIYGTPVRGPTGAAPQTDNFKYLGVMCDQAFNLNDSAGTFRAKKFVQEHDLANQLHAQIWLLSKMSNGKMCAIPAGMYESHIWATPNPRQAKEMDNPIQK